MIVNAFYPQNGISVFTENHIDTSYHAHPALELIIAKKGNFTLQTPHQVLKNICVGMVKANRTHLVQGYKGTYNFIMIEPERLVANYLEKILAEEYINMDIINLSKYWGKEINRKLIDEWANEKTSADLYTRRILECIQFIHLHIDLPFLPLHEFASILNLSPSRVSHLFKEHMGIPLQKYIIWVRLKKAVQCFLSDRMTLTQAALMAGFYDSSHFNKQFKEMLGLSPSIVYNSSCFIQASDSSPS